MAAGVKEHGLPRLPDSLEEVSRNHAYGHEGEHNEEGVHAPAGELLHIQVVRGEGGYKRLREAHDYTPGDKDEQRGVNHGEFQGPTYACEFPCPVVVADNGLAPVHKAHEREDNNGDNAVYNPEGGNSLVAAGHAVDGFKALVPVTGEAPGQNGVQEAVRNLHDAWREPQDENLPHVGFVELHVTAVDLDGGGFLHKELHHGKPADALAQNGGPGGAFDAPAELHDEQPVENHVAAGTDHDSRHGRFGVAHATDKVVHARDNRLEYGAHQNDAHVTGGDGQKLVASPEQLQEGRHENLAEREGADGHDNQEHEGVVQDDGRLLVLFFTEADGEERIAAHTHNHGHGHNKKGDREADGDSTDADTPDALTHEIAVNDVVKSLNQHADDGWDRKLQNDFRNARGAHGA